MLKTSSKCKKQEKNLTFTHAIKNSDESQFALNHLLLIIIPALPIHYLSTCLLIGRSIFLLSVHPLIIQPSTPARPQVWGRTRSCPVTFTFKTRLLFVLQPCSSVVSVFIAPCPAAAAVSAPLIFTNRHRLSGVTSGRSLRYFLSLGSPVWFTSRRIDCERKNNKWEHEYVPKCVK